MEIPTTRSRENTRARLFEAAAQLFAEVGLDGASVESICERAGFTRGAFYSNFATKNELFFELMVSLGAAHLAAVRARVDELTAAGVIHGSSDAFLIVEQILEAIGGDRTGVLLSAEIRVQALRDRELGAALIAHEDELYRGIEEIIDTVLAGGRFALRVSSVAAARMLTAACEVAVERATIVGEGDVQVQRAATESLRTVIALLLADDAGSARRPRRG